MKIEFTTVTDTITVNITISDEAQPWRDDQLINLLWDMATAYELAAEKFNEKYPLICDNSFAETSNSLKNAVKKLETKIINKAKRRNYKCVNIM